MEYTHVVVSGASGRTGTILLRKLLIDSYDDASGSFKFAVIGLVRSETSKAKLVKALKIGEKEEGVTSVDSNVVDSAIEEGYLKLPLVVC